MSAPFAAIVVGVVGRGPCEEAVGAEEAVAGAEEAVAGAEEAGVKFGRAEEELKPALEVLLKFVAPENDGRAPPLTGETNEEREGKVGGPLLDPTPDPGASKGGTPKPLFMPQISIS